MNQKLIIEAYKSIEYKGGEKLGNITVQINPDSYKLSKSTSYKKDESIKEDKQLPEYKHTNPSTLSFDIHFDDQLLVHVLPLLSTRKKVRQIFLGLTNNLLFDLLYQITGEREVGFLFLLCHFCGHLDFFYSYSHCLNCSFFVSSVSLIDIRIKFV